MVVHTAHGHIRRDYGAGSVVPAGENRLRMAEVSPLSLHGAVSGVSAPRIRCVGRRRSKVVLSTVTVTVIDDEAILVCNSGGRSLRGRPDELQAERSQLLVRHRARRRWRQNLGEAPRSAATLGLIAGNHVRIHHPVSAAGVDSGQDCSASSLGESEDPNKWGSQPNIWIYAAILAIDHTFMVDDFICRPGLGTLHVYGAIAENYRGPIGASGGRAGDSGYVKDYKYDDRLASDPPPYYLTPASDDCSLSESTIRLNGVSGARLRPFKVKISSARDQGNHLLPGRPRTGDAHRGPGEGRRVCRKGEPTQAGPRSPHGVGEHGDG